MIRKSLLAALLLLPTAGWSQQDSGLLERFESLGIREAATPLRDQPGWAPPRRIAVALPRRVADAEARVRQLAGDIEVTFISSGLPDPGEIDVFVGWCFPAALAPGSSVRYLHNYGSGLDRCSFDANARSADVIVTNGQKVASEMIGEHAIAMAFALARNLPVFSRAMSQGDWNRALTAEPQVTSLRGKVMLVLGLGGIGTQVARMASNLGMRVVATRNSRREGPDFVDYVGLSHEMSYLARGADVVVNALPLTRDTRGAVNGEFFGEMKPGAYYISVGRGGTTDTDALLDALNSGRLRGAGLDVTDPEPLPADHPLWQAPNVIITPHVSGASDQQVSLSFELAMENLGRYIRGDRLLNVVDLKRGY
ncbi:MAG: D-2-hydroxyacid dehydrogenase [Xanthomonadales bacterium]|nr:D-2-hydroxyacid dehydrogenase [Xanthomonadales bacterium]